MLNLCEQLNMICILHEHDIIIYSYIYVYCECELWMYVLVCELVYVLVCDLRIIIVCDFRIGTWNSGFWMSISNGSSVKTTADTYY
jgi:hypothetical protein